MVKFSLDGEDFEISEMNAEMQKLTSSLQMIDRRIQESSKLLIVLNKAKSAYIDELKKQVIYDKGGLYFDNDE